MLSIEPSDMKQTLEATQKEIHTLKDRLQTAQDELRQAEANVSQLKRKYALCGRQGDRACVYAHMHTGMLYACCPTPGKTTTLRRRKLEVCGCGV